MCLEECCSGVIQDSLGGNTRTVFIVTLSPSSSAVVAQFSSVVCQALSAVERQAGRVGRCLCFPSVGSVSCQSVGLLSVLDQLINQPIN